MSDSYQPLLKLDIDTRLPHGPKPDIGQYLYERYSNGSGKWLRTAFYLARPKISNEILLSFRKRYARIQSLNDFPAWPIEPVVVNAVDQYLREAVSNSGTQEVFRIGLWPDEKTFALVLSHDIESEAGFADALRLVEIEKEFGFTSSFYIVPERYPINWDVIEKLKAEGCEIGVQGLRHDGKLFQSRRIFEQSLNSIKQYAREWGAHGFRSPSTLRNVDWMPELGFEYDSSFPDTDPYEPQPGGCCSIWPYFIKDLVELPMTMPQDHTLFDILCHKDITVWKDKADWIAANQGMVMVDTHPDYLNTRERLNHYRELLNYVKSKPGMWHAQPHDVARWWKERNASMLSSEKGIHVIKGPIVGRGSVMSTTIKNNQLMNEFC